MKFSCQNCGRIMSVPDQYAGKRVRCPGCQTAQRVPMPGASASGQNAPLQSQPIADLSGLDDQGDVGVRRLRQVLIGCGACHKTIKVAESKFGKTTTCDACGTLLKVDAFNLSKTKGDLIDMTHLELEPADPLLDAGPHGSTIGGSSIQLEGSASGSMTGGYELNTSPSGSMSGSMSGVGMDNTSQSQMRELRELNELKHTGQITKEEYRERKKEIYAGKTLAIQAMSRSADGSGNRPVIKAHEQSSLLPKPVVWLIVAAVLGGGAFAGWSVLTGNDTSTPGLTATNTDTPTETVEKASESTAESEEAVTDGAELALLADDESLADELDSEVADEIAQAELFPVTMFEIEDNLGSIGVAINSSGESDSPVPVVKMEITAWPTPWPDYVAQPGNKQAIAKACELLQRITVRDTRALIGVTVGPAASGLDSPTYQVFRKRMHDILVDTAKSDGVFDDLNLRDNERTTQIGEFEVHRLHVTSRSNRSVRATIITGIQDGYCISYWFAGARSLYDEFLETVGMAEFGPI